MPPRLLLACAALLFSTGGAAIKATTLTSWQTAGFRSAMAAAVILLFLPDSRRGWSWRVLPVGLAYASTLLLFVHATKLTTAANAIFLQATAPAWLLIIGPLVLKEPVRRTDLLYSLTLAAGMTLFFLGAEDATQFAPNPAAGNLLGAASGLSWALTLTGLRWQATRDSRAGSLATVAVGNLLAMVICLPLALPVTTWTITDALVIPYLGIFQVGLAYLCLTKGMKHVPAFEASTILLLEPVMNPIWAWLLHGERPASLALLGGGVIVASTLVKTRFDRP